MNFKISSFLYLHHDEQQSENWERTTIEVLNAVFNQYKILFVEESKETAISFDFYVQAENEEIAKNTFLTAFKGYDVDNFSVLQE